MGLSAGGKSLFLGWHGSAVRCNDGVDVNDSLLLDANVEEDCQPLEIIIPDS